MGCICRHSHICPLPSWTPYPVRPGPDVRPPQGPSSRIHSRCPHGCRVATILLIQSLSPNRLSRCFIYPPYFHCSNRPLGDSHLECQRQPGRRNPSCPPTSRHAWIPCWRRVLPLANCTKHHPWTIHPLYLIFSSWFWETTTHWSNGTKLVWAWWHSPSHSLAPMLPRRMLCMLTFRPHQNQLPILSMPRMSRMGAKPYPRSLSLLSLIHLMNLYQLIKHLLLSTFTNSFAHSSLFFLYPMS